ncbi:MAG: hypothetical protein K940chlam2_01819 [Chlamydiae bacterium]|nr:hypothetical protein [Chlamydiota bacterium]
MIKTLLLAVLLVSRVCLAQVTLGVERFFEEGLVEKYSGKRVGLITNHTGVNKELKLTAQQMKECSSLKLVALFTPEHGLSGIERASAQVAHGKWQGIPVYSLHGDARRPSEQMLEGIDLLIFDIQDIGCRSYSYASTLYYAMEEAAKYKIPLIVLDRPNPMGGVVSDGPMLETSLRSFLGYINVPYCHGMTIGELARYFNGEYKVGCALEVVKMAGWKREMPHAATGLPWVPTSPYIPEADTPYYYATTGLIGALGVVSIGIGYTLPFKVIGAPWIDANDLAEKLQSQKLPGVSFLPFHYRPFYGKFKEKECHGVKIVITDPLIYRPVATQYMMMGLLKTLYPKHFQAAIARIGPAERNLFNKANGNSAILDIVFKEKYIAWKLADWDAPSRKTFMEKRVPYLLY